MLNNLEVQETADTEINRPKTVLIDIDCMEVASPV
jgi:hypothetical protein